MKVKLAAVAATTIALVAIALPAGAAVTYRFENKYRGSVVDSFTYVSDDFIADLPRLISSPSPSLTSCDYDGYSCFSVQFRTVGNNSVVTFTGANGSGSSSMDRFFKAGAFLAVGDYTNNTGLTTLRISGAPTAASVPEPATWAMFIGGFGLVGASLRRWRHATVRFG